MGSKISSITTLVVLLMVVAHWDGARAQSTCTMAIMSLSPCLNYISGNTSTPSSSCCSQLSSVVASQPQCLCTLLKGGASNLGIVINQTRALELPGACNVQTPPLSRCDGPSAAAPAPADSPSESPDDELPTTPSDDDVPSGAGSKTVPGTDGPSVGGSDARATFSFVGSLVLMFSAWAFS